MKSIPCGICEIRFAREIEEMRNAAKPLPPLQNAKLTYGAWNLPLGQMMRAENAKMRFLPFVMRLVREKNGWQMFKNAILAYFVKIKCAKIAFFYCKIKDIVIYYL